MTKEFAIKRRKVGEMDIPGGLVDVTDPCYTRQEPHG